MPLQVSRGAESGIRECRRGSRGGRGLPASGRNAGPTADNCGSRMQKTPAERAKLAHRKSGRKNLRDFGKGGGRTFTPVCASSGYNRQVPPPGRIERVRHDVCSDLRQGVAAGRSASKRRSLRPETRNPRQGTRRRGPVSVVFPCGAGSCGTRHPVRIISGISAVKILETRTFLSPAATLTRSYPWTDVLGLPSSFNSRAVRDSDRT